MSNLFARARRWSAAALAFVLVSTVAAAPRATVIRLSPMGLLRDDRLPAEATPLVGPVTVRVPPGRLGDVVLALAAQDKPLSQVRVVAVPLEGPGGRVLEVPAERIRTVVCWYGPLGGLGGPPDWTVKEAFQYEPYALLYDASLIKANHKTFRTEVAWSDWLDDAPPLKPRDVPKGQLRQWYVTVPVPIGTPPGEYRGALLFLSGAATVARVELVVDVPPITLLPPAKLYGIYHNIADMRVSDPRYYEICRDLAEAGFHNTILWRGVTTVKTPTGREESFADVEADMALRYRAGMDPDFILWVGSGINFYDFSGNDRKPQWAAMVARYWGLHPGYPPLALYGYDELHGERLRELSGAGYRTVREAGLRIGTACAPGYFAYSGNAIDYPIMAGGLACGATALATIAQARAGGATILTYAGPQLIYHDPFLYRLRGGFNLWTSPYDGWYPFTYAWSLPDHRTGKIVTTGRSGNFKAHGVVLVGKEHIIPQVEWPAMRQGVDDVRCATTLAAQVLAAREAKIKGTQVDAAEQLLRDPLGGVQSPAAIESARERILDAVLALQRLSPKLDTALLARPGPKAVARSVNKWILPDLTCRPFPMGLPEVQRRFDAMKRLGAEGKPFEATLEGYALIGVVRAAQEAGTVTGLEFAMLKATIGGLLIQLEKAALENKGDAPAEKYLKVAADWTDGWTFSPDRNDVGIKEGWSEPGRDRAGWQPIDTRKFWQRQGVTDWVQLEGMRVGDMGIGWYDLQLDIPENWAGRDLYLWFRCDEEAMVWVNGRLVRVRDEGPPSVRWNVPSLAPLKGALKPGERNEVVVRVMNVGLAGGLWDGVRVMEPK